MIRLYIGFPTVPFPPATGVIPRIRARFQTEAGTMVTDAIRSLLGTESLYSLSPEYAARKPRLSGFRREPGKSGDQPLIFSGEMYDAVSVLPNGDGFIVEVAPGSAVAADGFDYAEYFESGQGSGRGFTGVDYLGKGLDLVEDKLDELLADIIEQEMML